MAVGGSKTDLYQYFLRELAYLKEEGRRFAKIHPSEAKYLNVDETEIFDPHVERLIETFCFMTARVQRNIDMEYPSLIAYLANFMYPTVFAPVPSATIIAMDCDLSKGVPPTGNVIPKDTELVTRKEKNIEYGFKTVYPIQIFPIHVESIQKRIANSIPGFEDYGSHQMISITLCTDAASFNVMPVEKLRLYLNEEFITASKLYERIFSDVSRVLFANNEKIIGKFGTEAIEQVGFAQDQTLINVPENSQSARNILFDYCYFKQKFMFFDIVFPERLPATKELSIHLIFDSGRELSEITDTSFLINCTPVINMANYYSAPFALNDAERTYRIIPDTPLKEQLDVHSIEKVFLSEADSKTTQIPSIFDFKLHEDEMPLAWLYERSALGDKEGHILGMYLSFINEDYNYQINKEATVYASLNCISRDYYQLVEHVKFLQFKQAQPIKNLRTVAPLSKSYGPLIDSKLIWCLYSCLRFDQISLCEHDSGMALKDILRAVNRYNDNVVEHNIASLKHVAMRESATFIKAGYYPTTVRGYDFDLEINPDEYSGGSPFLFASVIESYLANLVAINSFTRVSLRYTNNNVRVKQWPAQIGKVSLI